MIRSPAGRLIVWNSGNDPYNFADLKYNWEALDSMFGNDAFVGGGSGSPGSTANRRQDLTGVATRWLGPGDTSKVYYKASHINNPNPTLAAKAPSRNLYRIIYALAHNQVPLGTVTAWYRHSDSVDPPNGWVICDGRTLNSDDHSYGDHTLQVPDLRNKFILGADETLSRTTAGVAADNLNYADGNNAGGLATNAPGVGYDSIRNTSPGITRVAKNAKRNLSHSHGPGTYKTAAHRHGMGNHNHQIAAHTHTVPAHAHAMDHVHALAEHYHGSPAISPYSLTPGTIGDVVANPGGSAVAPNFRAIGYNAQFSVTTSPSAAWSQQFHGLNDAGFWPRNMFEHRWTSRPVNATANTYVNTESHPATETLPNTTGTSGPPSTSMTDESQPTQIAGSSADAGFHTPTDVPATNLVDMRPAYVGLLYIMKVKKYFGIIDDDRDLFDSL